MQICPPGRLGLVTFMVRATPCGVISNLFTLGTDAFSEEKELKLLLSRTTWMFVMFCRVYTLNPVQ